MLQWLKDGTPVWVALITTLGSVGILWLTGRQARRLGKPNGQGNMAEMAGETLKILKDLQPQVHQLREDLMNHIHDGHPAASKARNRRKEDHVAIPSEA
jgi:hypothetical protein